ncbi:MAG: (deoxy)nucleoside triphosphate pyrophosphohydrolase [Planctomycetaceae bacterium]|nr:(deoxy)nucleoside triphosphate pyrophosphohydrolase [Planctomycetaceae bacterium]
MSHSPLRVGIAIVVHDGRYLVGVRPEGKSLAGYSEFPGGKCEPGESSDICAIRECFEETGLIVIADELLLEHRHRYPHGELDLGFWRCRVAEGYSTEAQNGFRWVPLDEVLTLKFPEANAPVLKLLHPAEAQG